MIQVCGGSKEGIKAAHCKNAQTTLWQHRNCQMWNIDYQDLPLFLQKKSSGEAKLSIFLELNSKFFCNFCIVITCSCIKICLNVLLKGLMQQCNLSSKELLWCWCSNNLVAIHWLRCLQSLCYSTNNLTVFLPLNKSPHIFFFFFAKDRNKLIRKGLSLLAMCICIC